MHERDRHNLFPQSHSSGMNYSLFIMVLKEMVSMEGKGQPGAAPAMSPLLSLQSIDLYCVFHVSPMLPHEITWGFLLITFMLGRFGQAEVAAVGPTRGYMRPTMWPGSQTAWCWLFSSSRRLMSATLFFKCHSGTPSIEWCSKRSFPHKAESRIYIKLSWKKRWFFLHTLQTIYNKRTTVLCLQLTVVFVRN
jgi:hypothetical protein